VNLPEGLPGYLIYRSILTGRTASPEPVHEVVDDVIIPASPGTMPGVFIVVSGPVSYRQCS
jgi:hypothetical protein